MFVQTGKRSSTSKAFTVTLYFQTFISLFLKLWTNSERQETPQITSELSMLLSRFRSMPSPTVKEVFKPGGHAQVHVPQNVTPYPLHFFFFFPKPRKKLVTGFISTFPVFLLGFLSLPPGALSLTDWKLISTQLTFHEHWGPFYLYWHNLSCSVGDISPSPVAQLP